MHSVEGHVRIPLYFQNEGPPDVVGTIKRKFRGTIQNFRVNSIQWEFLETLTLSHEIVFENKNLTGLIQKKPNAQHCR